MNNIKKIFENYKERKILLLIVTIFVFLSLIFQVIMYFNFFNRLGIEKNWINSGDVFVENWKSASPTYQLIPLFLFLNTIFVVDSIISLGILVWMQYKLYKNIGNSDEHFKSMYFLLTFLFISSFATISLQPENVTRNVVIFINEEFREEKDFITYSLNYSLIWASMIMSFVSLILTISAKRKFGYVTKDAIIHTNESKENQEKIKFLKQEIQSILDGNKPTNNM